ncbi:Aste57867_22039 [Aphanomyces stellatus]|uniref:Aste57867_22039 protein n=1 Tax=Aphanomyces stellatus TaxID=120398 RepID=A0A485LJ69_9STRA|nr:hypothetical protein As57867_021970 [Aphanomyces stellatus]VFT98707.1 Aste57867_22039 [Aphanomyces stellatus]
MEAKLVALQRQSREQHALRNTFSRTIASRFFVDGSLARQKRLAETARRRQERLAEKTRLERLKGEWLRRQYEERKELEDKKREREMDRATRRLQAMSAEVIQAAWRRWSHDRLYWRLVHHAATLIQITLGEFCTRRRVRRHRAATRLRRWWRLVAWRRQRQRAANCITACVHRCVLRRRSRVFRMRWAAAVVVQRVWHGYWRMTTAAAAATIQRWARRKHHKKQIKRLASIYQHLRTIERMDASARVLQRRLGHAAVAQRIKADTAFRARLDAAKQPEVKSITMPSGTTEHRLREAAARETALKLEEARVLREIETLRQVSLPKATQRRNDERESLRRMRALESQRAAKDKHVELLRLRELEDQARRDIRLDMEKRWDQERREKIKLKTTKGATAPTLRQVLDSRLEVNDVR